MLGNEEKKRGYQILVGTIVDAFTTADHINPDFKKRKEELIEQYRGRYFNSDFIYDMYVLRQSVPFIDPLFRRELHMIVDRAFENNLRAIRAVVTVEKEMMKVEGELIQLEAETRMKMAEQRLREHTDQAFEALQNKLETSISAIFANENEEQSYAQERPEIADDADIEAVMEQALREFKQSTLDAHKELSQEFDAAANKELPVIERMQTCRRHIRRAMETVKSIVMDI